MYQMLEVVGDLDSVTGTSRKGNEVADHLAACALKGTVQRNWILQPPLSLAVVLRMGLNHKELAEERKKNISDSSIVKINGNAKGRMENDEENEAYSGGGREGNSEGKWQKPEWGTVKINVEVEYCQKTQKAAMGVVGRDWNGRFMGGVGRMMQVESYNMAEGLTMLEVLQCGDIWWGGKVEVETTCQRLAGELNKGEREKDESSIGDSQCAEIRKACLTLMQAKEYNSWSMSLVGRKGNTVAKCLVTEVMRGLVPQGWLEQPPTSLMELMRRDLKDNMGTVSSRSGIG